MSSPQSSSEQNKMVPFVSSAVYYEEDEIDLYEWLTLKKRKKVVLLTTFLFSFWLVFIYYLFLLSMELILCLNKAKFLLFRKKYADNLSYLLK